MKKFSLLVFIDDDYPTNRFHEIIVKESDLCENVLFFDMPNDAVDYFKEASQKENFVMPDLFFVDMNMPRYNGFQLLEQLAEILPVEDTRAVMLTTSDIPGDQQKARNYPQILGFSIKPLSEEMLRSYL
ncbi:MAG: response regulator [Bacteroidota bacterium]